jgi:alpha-glucosidase (family GH31 glycosyl hydrolase)
MKIKFVKIMPVLIILILFTVSNLSAQQDNSYVELKDSSVTRVIHFINESVARVTLSVNDADVKAKESLIVKERPKKVDVHYEEYRPVILMVTKYLILYVNRDNGAVKYEDWKGYDSIEEDQENPYEFTDNGDGDSTTFKVKLNLNVPKHHRLYIYDPMQLSVKPTDFANIRNSEVSSSDDLGIERLPFIYSDQNYGIVWDNNSKSVFHDGEDGTWISSESGEYIDYYIIFGPSLKHVITAYRKLVGLKKITDFQ